MVGFLRLLSWLVLLGAVLAAFGAYDAVTDLLRALDIFDAGYMPVVSAIIAFVNLAFFGALGLVLADIAEKQSTPLASLDIEPSVQTGRKDLRSNTTDVHRFGLLVGSADSESESGLRVDWVAPFGPASRVGLNPGDVITHVNGRALEGLTREVQVQVLAKATRPKLAVRRDNGAELTVKLEVE